MPLIKQCLYLACQVLQYCNCIRLWLLVAADRADQHCSLGTRVFLRMQIKMRHLSPASCQWTLVLSCPSWFVFLFLSSFFFFLLVSNLCCYTKNAQHQKPVYINSISYCLGLENNDQDYLIHPLRSQVPDFQLILLPFFFLIIRSESENFLVQAEKAPALASEKMV